MSRNDLSRLFDQLDSMSLGFGHVFREFHSPTTLSYPPHNIIQKSENEYIVEMAVAGFKKHEISVTEHRGNLVITGTKDLDTEYTDSSYQYRGLARRNFEKSLKMAEYVKIVDATLADGILSITLMRNIPDAAQPRIIAIK